MTSLSKTPVEVLADKFSKMNDAVSLLIEASAKAHAEWMANSSDPELLENYRKALEEQVAAKDVLFDWLESPEGLGWVILEGKANA